MHVRFGSDYWGEIFSDTLSLGTAGALQRLRTSFSPPDNRGCAPGCTPSDRVHCGRRIFRPCTTPTTYALCAQTMTPEQSLRLIEAAIQLMEYRVSMGDVVQLDAARRAEDDAVLAEGADRNRLAATDDGHSTPVHPGDGPLATRGTAMRAAMRTAGRPVPLDGGVRRRRRRHACETCRLTSADGTRLRPHARLVRGERRRPARPPGGCGKRFSAAGNPDAHSVHRQLCARIGRSSLRPHTCESRGYIAENIPSKHMCASHSTAAPYACGACISSFDDATSVEILVHAPACYGHPGRSRCLQ